MSLYVGRDGKAADGVRWQLAAGHFGHAFELQAVEAEEADGIEGLTRVVRDQIGKGADWIRARFEIRGKV